MIINTANLTNLNLGFKTAFNQGLGMAQPQYERIVTRVPSSTAEEKYGWMGQLQSVKEWIGDRAIHNLAAHDYAIRNKDYENTIAVPRNAIADDQFGVFTPMFAAMGQTVAAFPNQLVFNLLKAGFTTLGYDGQYFFDTDHPVLDANGVPQSVANTDGGSGTPWFLMDLNQPLKPIIWQERQPFTFTAMDKPDNEQVFMKKEFRYGVDGRCNVGFGFWQFAWGSKQTLNAENYAEARAALQSMKGDYGRPLGLNPNVLVYPPSLESAARKLIINENASGGESNEWKGTAELLCVPWLA